MSGSGGQVRQRPNGLWEGRYIGADRRRHSVYAKTRKEAQERLRAALTAADHGVRPSVSRVTVAAWLEEWMTTSVEPRCRPSTVVSYRSTVARYIIPAIGRVPLSKLEPTDVQRMLAGLARQNLSTTTVRYAYAVLRIALGRALKAGKVIRNVATLVDQPAASTTELRPLSADQVRTFLDSIEGSRQEPLYVLAVALGMRQGELLGLRWQDVDLDAGTLTVRHTLRIGTDQLAEPKTDRSRRTLRLSPDVASLLRSHKARQAAERLAAGPRWHDGGFVFATPHGTPLNASNVTHAFQAALRHVGLPRQRFHDLRHAFATLQLEDGEELAVISRMLGHANFSTTANVYAHVTPASLQRSADRMDGILRRRVVEAG
jgi:integrase